MTPSTHYEVEIESPFAGLNRDSVKVYVGNASSRIWLHSYDGHMTGVAFDIDRATQLRDALTEAIATAEQNANWAAETITAAGGKVDA